MSREVTITQLAELKGLSISGASRLVTRTGVPYSKVGNKRLVDLDQLEALSPAASGKITIQSAAARLMLHPDTIIRRATQYGVMVYVSPLDRRQQYVDPEDLQTLRAHPRQASPDSNGERQCTHCYQTKPLSEFYDNHRHAHCRACHQVMVLAWRAKNKEKVREINRRANATRYAKIRAQRQEQLNG